ncbi:DUF3080 family protein [Alteromonas sp. 345S023]|uniref:DUF3080 family protein n=1 Tax=Alteromonas profundi TaxID=2696062 RepID=A0A7X5LIJ6_9ALTE|nr:DUF3080 family protein [Alteromonas profundi]NDV89938.1 DUF3080 family protein [Alteromonas profundi]
MVAPHSKRLQFQWKASVVLMGLVLLSGCFGHTGLKANINEYRTRLARVLDSPIAPADADKHTLRYPSVSERVVNVTPVNINLRNFYAIQDCELGRIVAQRNTVLGKTQLPSQRFAYEQKLGTVLANCEEKVSKNNKQLAALINNWREQKRAQWPQIWAQLIQNSSEMKQGLSLASSLLEVESSSQISSSVNALYYLDSLAHRSDKVGAFNSNHLEAQLRTLSNSRLPAKLWLTQQLLTNELTTLTGALKRPLASVNCPKGRASEKAKVLRNVFYLFFIEKIQPVGSKLNQIHYQLAPLWQRWVASDALSPAFKQFIATHAHEGFSEYQDAMHEHVRLWQDFLGRCNLAPVAVSRL